MNDHARGCEGREYTCTCGYDTQQDARIAALSAENERLRKALEFYADRGFDGYDVDLHSYGLGMKTGAIIKDGGDIARAALEAKP